MGHKPIGPRRSAGEDSFELTSTTSCLSRGPRIGRGVGSGANRTEFGSPFVFQSECPVTLKGIGVKTAPEGDSGPPFVFQSKCRVTHKGIETESIAPDRFGSEGVRVDVLDVWSTFGTRRPEGPSRRDGASRVVRNLSDGSRRIKPVEVEAPRHAISCRSGRVSL